MLNLNSDLEDFSTSMDGIVDDWISVLCSVPESDEGGEGIHSSPFHIHFPSGLKVGSAMVGEVAPII